MLATRHVLACLALFLTAAIAHAQAAPGPGDKAPPITLDALTNAPEGAQATWEALGTGTTVIEFWGTWCGPCVAAIPHLNELHDEFAPKGVNFLSVTYEEPEIINRFHENAGERLKLHTWIGHDMDRSMVKDYAVRGWPTTFIVRDGTIVARTHPSALTKERLATIVEGKADPRAAHEQQNEKQPGQLGPDGRPILTGGITPGIDPYAPIKDRPAIQVIVRPAGDARSLATSGSGVTVLGQPIKAIIATAYQLDRYAIEVDAAVGDDLFDVIYRVPRDQYATHMPLVRELIIAGLGVRLETEKRETDAYELQVADTGLKLESSGIDRALGFSTSGTRTPTGTSMRITSASTKMVSLVDNLSGFLGMPILDRTDHDGYLLLDLELPDEMPKLSEVLLEQAGLTLVPTRHEIEFAIIKPAN